MGGGKAGLTVRHKPVALTFRPQLRTVPCMTPGSLATGGDRELAGSVRLHSHLLFPGSNCWQFSDVLPWWLSLLWHRGRGTLRLEELRILAGRLGGLHNTREVLACSKGERYFENCITVEKQWPSAAGCDLTWVMAQAPVPWVSIFIAKLAVGTLKRLTLRQR
jgi:hypothetical protein